MKLNGLKFEHIGYGKIEKWKSYSIYLSDTRNLIESKNQVNDQQSAHPNPRIPHLDCSQLWSPSKRSLIQNLEKLQKAGNYWEIAKKNWSFTVLNVVVKDAELSTLGPSSKDLSKTLTMTTEKVAYKCCGHQRTSRKCHLNPVNTKHKNIWRDSLSEEGPWLFNLFPKTTECI